MNVKWSLDYRYMDYQPTYVEKIDIKAIIDILNYKRYTVENFELLSVADPKLVVEGKEAIKPAKIFFSKDARPIDNGNKPKGWSVYYSNGAQILEMEPEKIKDILSKRSFIVNSETGEQQDKIESFSSHIKNTTVEIWTSLKDWVRSI